MKAVFIIYNQAYNEDVVNVLDKLDVRGFTRWTDVQGKGSVNGEPHLDNHAWPMLNHAVITMVQDEKVGALLAEVKAMDESAPELGLRAFVWNVEMFY